VVFSPMACRAHVVACMPCQAHAFCPCCGMSSHILACFVNPMSWDALSSPCRGMSSPCRGMSSPCQGMSSPCQGMSSPCCSMPFAHIVACLAISWHVLSIPCRGMPCQAHVEACRAHVEACRARVKACQALVVACLLPILWHV
jgi:hypothetical protein